MHSTPQHSCHALQGGADGDTVLIYPAKIDPHCEALVFVLSASDSDVSTMNLSTPDTLQFHGHSAGETKRPLHLLKRLHCQRWKCHVHWHVHRHWAALMQLCWCHSTFRVHVALVQRSCFVLTLHSWCVNRTGCEVGADVSVQPETPSTSIRGCHLGLSRRQPVHDHLCNA